MSREAVGSAAIVASRLCKKRLPNNSSIFSAEARGILLALDMIHWSTDSQFLFLSDSLSCLQSLQNQDLSHPLIAEILCHVHSSVVFMWVPGHVGLAGNSAADSAAKDAVLLPVSSMTVPHSDYKSLIRLQALRQWQLHWNCETENKLHLIEPRVNVINIFRLPWRDEIIIHRLRIGHTYLAHGHLLRGETPPRCLACQVDLTVEHVLLHCVSFTNARDNFLYDSYVLLQLCLALMA